MKEKILQVLKIKYYNLGFSSETLEGVAAQLAGFVKEEKDIETTVAGFEPMLKQFQSDTGLEIKTCKGRDFLLK
jgi:hypothetical protein